MQYIVLTYRLVSLLMHIFSLYIQAHFVHISLTSEHSPGGRKLEFPSCLGVTHWEGPAS